MSKETYPAQNGLVCDPALDGITHVNVYTKGATKIGRALSNMSNYPITIGGETFKTVEGYWWYLATGSMDESFKWLSGFESRTLGMSLKKVIVLDFKERIKAAVEQKIRNHQWIRDELTKSTLPLQHYYVYGKDVFNCKVRLASNSFWLIEFIEELRGNLKKETKYEH